MDWLTTLRRSGGINALSRQLGASPADVSAAATALLPALLAGLRQAADTLGEGDAGVQSLVDVLAELGGGQLAADVMGPGPLDTAPGVLLLDRVLGPEVARRAVLVEAERSQGLALELGERVLPALAMLVGGYITARAGGSGAEGSGGLDELGGLRDTLTPDAGDSGADRI
ncbi:DUF937 domain-containing protein [Novosphingobium sp. PS1R-30]|uniref:DUF937 domain-containing protein n=1 Tax=Novosphingobium anseongense TaxID=3133436 RepID=A0ABU8RRP4_9SPHN|nr:MAG: hypothetical protein EOO76_11975 [Novosphingobium sp.]